MKKIILIVIIISTAISTVVSVNTTENSGNPTYCNKAFFDNEGAVEGYTYMFPTGDIEAARGECLLMINGTFSPDAKVIIQNGRSLIPVQCITEAYGGRVDWDKTMSRVIIKNHETDIVMNIGRDMALVNGKEVTLDTAPIIAEGCIYVPLRFVGEALGKEVGYLPAIPEDATAKFNHVSASQIGIAFNPVLWIDEPYHMNNSGESIGELLIWQRVSMTRHLNALKPTIEATGEKQKNIADVAYETTEKQIAWTAYIGQAGRYAVFNGPYVTLVDASADKIYFDYSDSLQLADLKKRDTSNLLNLFPFMNLRTGTFDKIWPLPYDVMAYIAHGL